MSPDLRGIPLEPRLPSLRERLGEELWGELLAGSRSLHANSGDVIAGTHNPVQTAAVIAGRCRVYSVSRTGRQITFRYSQPGEVLGMVTMVTGWREWGAEAVLPSEYVPISSERLHGLIDSNLPFLRAYLAEFAAVASDAVRMVIGCTSESMETRIAAHLLESAFEQPDGRCVAIVTHQRLADSTGTAREVVTRTLRRFRVAGAIRTGAGMIEIVDRDRLVGIAENGNGASRPG